MAPPRPPSLELPKPPSDLRAQRKGDKVILTWTVPKVTTDRQTVRNLGPTHICRGLEPQLTDCGAPVGEAANNAAITSTLQKVAASYTDSLPSEYERDDASASITYAIEVLNTDAEGRMILIDALTYAQRLGCTHLVDAATLTGAIVVALGAINVGAFSNNEAFLQKLLSAAKAEGEKMWQLPLDEEYKEQLKSAFADLHNIGGRPAGSITAAMFLRDFVGDTPWIHLDIAGTAWLDDAKPYMGKGASGVGVRTFIKLAESW
jgi:hypothetical protein